MPIATVHGIDLFYDLTGPEVGPVVAFSNSLGTSLAMWEAQAAALTGRFRCLRYDTRGHGRSATLDRPATIEDLAGDLRGLLDHLGIARAHIVGLSLGGMTAQAFAATSPERVDRLVLMATAPHLPPATLWTERAATARRDGMGALVDAVIARWFTPAFHDAPQVGAVRRQLMATDPAGYAAACGVIAGMDLRPRLGRIGAPTLIISGADDPSTPPARGEELRAGIAGAEFVVLPGAAHLLNIEAAARVNRHLLGFLDAAA
ncbi:3-oxoadipate enol-lactonase [Methylobacterium planeticum]|uniref:3-oxoadipate enol-lactonase n=1 Tax=Methylobacterium planeticum TaxID=2615211 RepID=A0A6N6MVI6_9HYPH|nr:3-oxoadipate enol-lactonase [Methylobacterium planeticum]KAB1074613.1 3-oxoadipate enol-lactonase [Methylobacterium planeticum]